jgi:hypothetical protein
VQTEEGVHLFSVNFFTGFLLLLHYSVTHDVGKVDSLVDNVVNKHQESLFLCLRIHTLCRSSRVSPKYIARGRSST